MALDVFPIQPNSGVLVLPTMTQPARAHPCHEGVVGTGGRVVGVQCRPVGRDVASGVLQVFDADRNSGEGARVAALGDAGVDGLGIVERPVPISGDEGVVDRVQPLDPGEGGLGQLPGADLLRPHRPGELGH